MIVRTSTDLLLPDEGDQIIERLERLRPRLKQIMAYYRLSKEDAEDLVQTLALSALRRFSEIQDLEAWLCGATWHICADVKKKRRLESLNEEQLLETEHLRVSPPQERIGLYVDLRRAVAGLPERQAEVVVLRALGFTRDEIASRTGYSPESIRKIAIRGLARLRAQLVVTPNPTASSLSLSSPKKLVTCVSRTRRGKLTDLRSFAAWMGEEDPYRAIAELLGVGQQAAETMVARYRATMVERGLAMKTVGTRIRLLRQLVRLAAEHGLIQWQLEPTPLNRTFGGRACTMSI